VVPKLLPDGVAAEPDGVVPELLPDGVVADPDGVHVMHPPQVPGILTPIISRPAVHWQPATAAQVVAVPPITPDFIAHLAALLPAMQARVVHPPPPVMAGLLPDGVAAEPDGVVPKLLPDGVASEPDGVVPKLLPDGVAADPDGVVPK
jgi:hypothetical protein